MTMSTTTIKQVVMYVTLACAMQTFASNAVAKKSAAIEAAAATPTKKETVTLKIATLAPKGSLWAKYFDKLSEKISTETKGAVKLKIYPGGIQGDESEVVAKLKRGQLDGAAVTAIGLSQINPEALVLQMPGVFKNEAAIDRVRSNTSVIDAFDKSFDKKGYKLLGWGEYGWIHLFTKKKISSIDDIKKEKVWQWTEDKIVGHILKRLGISGTPRSLPEVYPALGSGALTVVFNTMYGAMAMQWHSLVNYYVDEPLALGIGATVLTNSAAKKLTADQWTIVQDLSKRAHDGLIKKMRADSAKTKKALAKMGIKAIKISPADKKKLDAVSKETVNSFSGKFYTKTLLSTIQSTAK